MPCAACGHENRPQAKFCEECGAPLCRSCPRCGAELSAAGAFCDHCGQAVVRPEGPRLKSGTPASDPRAYTPRHLAERILTSRAALEGERKQVTVLFADVQGSMALAEQVDAEEWHGIMSCFLALLAEGVHRFEGTVNQYTGDGVMALFGAPLAHEDHAQRACYAALHLTDTVRQYAQALRRERGLRFSVRMGLNSGEVVVGKIGDDLRMDYTAQGHTVGLAARMEQLCEPGRVYLTEHTAALVAGFFRLEDLGPFTIKGVREPVRVFALLGTGSLRTRLDVSRARGLSRFVGRTAELAVLEDELDRAAAGAGRVVGVVADAGLGKSRLCAEFLDRCRARGVGVCEAHAFAHASSVPFLPIRDLFRQLVGIGENDGADAARRAIAGTLLLLDDQLKPVLPVVFDFLGVPDASHPSQPADPDARLRQLVEVLADLLRARAERAPLVVVVEDLHWLDRSSEAFLARLVEGPGLPRVLLLVNFRPGYDASWVPAASHRRLHLEPLGEDAIGELLDERLGRDPSVSALAARVRERAAGNPFFLEEIVRSLVEAGYVVGTVGSYRLTTSAAEAPIPATVQAVLAARIDRLSGRDKDVLQTAAVIGKQFSQPLLRAVVPLSEGELTAALSGLAAAELVVEQEVYPVALYAFRHPLTQEVAYVSQLGERRARLHAEVARAIAALDAARLDEHAALIAYHWERAGAPWEAAQWNRRAAQAASGTDAREAIGRLHTVLALLREVPESAESVALELDTRDGILRLGMFTDLARGEAESVFTAGRRLAERTGSRPLLARLTSTFGSFQMHTGHLADASSYSQQAVDLVRQVEDASVRASVLADEAQTAFWSGRVREALGLFDQVLAMVRAGQWVKRGIGVGLSGEPFILAMRGLCLSFMGRGREGGADLDRALALAHADGGSEGLCVANVFRSFGATVMGDGRAALAHAQAAVDLTARMANPFLERMASATLGATYVSNGRAEEGTRVLEEFVAPARDSGFATLPDWFLLPSLAVGYLEAGDGLRARDAANEAVAVARAHGARTAECAAQLSLAMALAATEGATAGKAIEDALRRIDALVEETGATVFVPRTHLARAVLALLAGDEAAWAHHTREAHRLFAEMGMTERARETERQLAGEATGKLLPQVW